MTMTNGYVKTAGKTHRTEYESEIEDLLREINGSPIVVEGIRDEKALLGFGFKNIHKIAGKPLDIVADNISSKYDSVAILTDYDEEGEKAARLLEKFFNHAGTKILTRFRRKFRSVFKVATIEEALYAVNRPV